MVISQFKTDWCKSVDAHLRKEFAKFRNWLIDVRIGPKQSSILIIDDFSGATFCHFEHQRLEILCFQMRANLKRIHRSSFLQLDIQINSLVNSYFNTDLQPSRTIDGLFTCILLLSLLIPIATETFLSLKASRKISLVVEMLFH